MYRKMAVLALAAACSATVVAQSRPTQIGDVQFGYADQDTPWFNRLNIPGVGWIAMPSIDDARAALKSGDAALQKDAAHWCTANGLDDQCTPPKKGVVVLLCKDQHEKCTTGNIGFDGALAMMGTMVGLPYIEVPSTNAYQGQINGIGYNVDPSRFGTGIDQLRLTLACESWCSSVFSGVGAGCPIAARFAPPMYREAASAACSIGVYGGLGVCLSRC